MDIAQRIGHRLIQLGVLLFLLGLMTGFVVPVLALPRMGLASHLEGLMNGIFLMALGLVWPRLSLPAFWHQVSFWLAVFGTFANWLAVLLSAFWGAAATMPIIGGGATGAPIHEQIVFVLLMTLSIAMVALCVILLAGLRSQRA